MLWLIPIVADTVSVSPDRDEVRRAFEQYPGQLDVRSETSYSLAAEVFTRSGPVAIAALLLIPLAAFAARRRWAAFVVGGSLAVFAFMLVPLLFTTLSDLVSISQARRAAGFLPFAFAFAGGLGVLSRVLWPWLPPIALVAGRVLQYLYPGDFDYAFDDPGPAWVVWVAVVGCAAALVVGFVRRSRPPVEDAAGLAAALFLAPVVAVGLAKWNPVPTPPLGLLSPGLVEAVRDERAGARDRLLRPGDELPDRRLRARVHRGRAARPRRRHDGEPAVRAGARRARVPPHRRPRDPEALRRRVPRRRPAAGRAADFDLQELYRDARFVLYRLPSARSRRRRASRSGGDRRARDRRSRTPEARSPFRRLRPGQPVLAAGGAARRERAALREQREPAALEHAELADDAVSAAVAPVAARAARSS